MFLACVIGMAAVFADVEERTIYVFPSGVTSDNWMKQELSLEQDLSASALVGDFNRQNSSFVIYETGGTAIRDERAQSQRDTPESEQTDENGEATIEDVPSDTTSDDEDSDVREGAGANTELERVQTETDSTDEDASVSKSIRDARLPYVVRATSEVLPQPLRDVSMFGYVHGGINSLLFNRARAQEAAPLSDTETVANDEDASSSDVDTTADEQTIAPALTPEESDGEVAQDGEGTDEEKGLDESNTLPSADSIQTNSAVDAEDPTQNELLGSGEDVRICTVLGLECHTVQFTGFDIGSVLSEHQVESYELKLSLGARTFGEGFTPDKLMVRYYHKGGWHLAGEVAIDRERSNFENGGHFSFPLPDLTGWDALRDLAVELEYVRQSESRTELFVDAVWVDTRFTLASPDADIRFGKNVREELAVLEDSNRPDVLRTDEARIELAATDQDEDEPIVVRTDANLYHGLTNGRAYVSVSNTTTREQEVTVTARTTAQAEITALYARMENVPREDARAVHSDVGYYCEAGWEVEGGVTSYELRVASGDDETTETTDNRQETRDTTETGEVTSATEDSTETADATSGTEVTTEGGDGGEVTTEAEEDGQETTDLPSPVGTGYGEASTEQIQSASDATTDTTDEARANAAEEGEEFPPITLSTTYTCRATGESETCNALNQDGTNCIVEGEVVDVERTISYEGAWVLLETAPFNTAPRMREDLLDALGFTEAEVLERDAPHLERGKTVNEPLVLYPGETRFFMVEFTFPVQRAGEFLIEVESDEQYATKSAWWRSGWQYRIPLELSGLAREEHEVLPTLHRLTLAEGAEALFAHAAVSGEDVRFYDPIRKIELASARVAHSYVEAEAVYDIELLELPQGGTTTIFAYVGNEYVTEDGRLPAPTPLRDPVPYVGIVAPLNGAVLSLTSLREHNRIVLPDSGEEIVLGRFETRDVLVPDTQSFVEATGPISVRSADRNVTLDVLDHSHLQVATGSDQIRTYDIARFVSTSTMLQVGELEELPIPATLVFDPEPIDLGEHDNLYERSLLSPLYHNFLDALRDFGLDELPQFRLSYTPQRSGFMRFVQGIFRETATSVAEVKLYRNGVEVTDIELGIEYTAENEWMIKVLRAPRGIVPGKYTVELTIDEFGKPYTDRFEFYWGVLAINMPQSVYEVGDLVEFHMAALDDKGDTICDADLRLSIETPAGERLEQAVTQQPSCGPNNVTDEPDYRASFRPETEGAYILELTHVDRAGAVVHRTSDRFEVRPPQPFVIKRTGATRIWPKAPYVMELTVTALSDFSGELVEAVPERFVISEAGEGTMDAWGNAKRITWPLDIAAGETKTYTYTYDAPDISPYLYLVGPAIIRATDGEAVGGDFAETRQWKLASDALGSYVERKVDFTASAANAWVTVDLSGAPYDVPANAVVEIAVKNTDQNTQRNAGARAQGSTQNRYFTLVQTGAGAAGTTFAPVSLMVNTSATSSIQVFAANSTAEVTFTLLGYWTDGTYVERMDQIDPNNTNATWGNIALSSYGVSDGNIAEMVVANYDAANNLSGGVRSASTTDERRVPLNAPTGGGLDAVTMFARASGTNATIEGYAQVEGNNGASIDFYLVGYWSVPPSGLTYVSTYADLGTPAGSTAWEAVPLDTYGVPKQAIAEVFVGNNGDANNGMSVGVREKASVVSRAYSHAEADDVAYGILGSRMLVTADNTASATIEWYAENTAQSEFHLLGWWQPANYPPESPTLYDVPFDNEKTGSSTPYFEFTASDPDGSSGIVYAFEWDDDGDLDDAPLGSRSSDDESGCSPDCFENLDTPADVDPFTENERVRFTIQDTLESGTTYYWRVRAKDVAGSNEWSEWSETHSATYVVDTDPKGWLQTGDTQFDGGVLTGTETYGSDKVRLSTTPPSGALAAFGVSGTTTPNVRLWDGTTWAASSGALDVGSTVSWTVLRAGTARNEYILGTQDTDGDVNVQVYDATLGTWSDLFEVADSIPNAAFRGFDIAVQSQSGDAYVAYCYGREAAYAVWDGVSWSATSSINLSFTTQNCEWLTMRPNPVTDDLIMLARANVAETPYDYNAVAYDSASSQWGTPAENGVGEDAWAEGMAIGFEADGSAAVVAFSDGGGPRFSYLVYDGEWDSVETDVVLGDDFEWGEMASAVSSNDMALCYQDEANDIGVVFWDGDTNSWGTFTELETSGMDGITNADLHGRPFSCLYETTAGREDYVIVPYSDTTRAEYSVYDTSSWAYTLNNGLPISTIEDSWTVGSVRTGNGLILSAFHDVSNSRYDFSYWNGVAWSNRETLEENPSRTAEPWYEPVMLAAQQYQASAGTVQSPIIDFDSVPNRPTWGEALWSATTPVGTAVTFQVMYATSTNECTAPIPDLALPGNSAGFSATSSPLDLSGLSTSTYNQICLHASLTSQTAQSPTLDDWSVSWERTPYLTQEAYRFYLNDPSYTPSDVWPEGVLSVAESTPITGDDIPPKPGDVLRLRMSVKDANVALPAGDRSFKLQYAEGATCSADLGWSDVAPAASSTALWRGYENDISTSWYDATFPYRVAVTINADQIDETLTDFPVFVDLADLDATFWSNVQSGGGDIRVTAADGTSEVPREVVFASTTADTGELYFKATTTSSTTDTVFYIYYGSTTASDYASTSTYGAQNVWDNNYVLVTHMHDLTTATTKNSAASTNNGTKQSAGNPVESTTALFGRSQDLVNDDISHGNLGIGATSHTLEAWVYPDTLSGGGDQGTYGFTIIGASPTGVYAPWLTVGGSGANVDEVRYCAYQTSSTCTVSTGAGITTGAWYYIAATAVKSGSTIVKVNDTQRISYTNAGNADFPTQFTIGDLRPTRAIYFDGKIDEVRVSNMVRSAAWQKATYQNGIGNLVSVGGSTSQGDGNTVPSLLLSNSDERMSYEEENDSVENPTGIAIGDEGEWDWVIQNNGAPSGTNYCFRMINSDNTPLSSYTRYPTLTTNDVPDQPVHEAPFDNVAATSTTPYFDFVTEDPEGDDVHYQIQIDDDPAFGSPTLDRNSLDHFAEFKNLVTPADKSPFTSGDSIRFTPGSALVNGTTYWWRVRAQDINYSGGWGEWSESTSLTVNTGLTFTTWYQTTVDQFERLTHENTEASSTEDAVALIEGQTAGTSTTPTIEFAWGTVGNAWGSLSWTEDETFGSIRMYVLHNNGGVWELVPDTDLPGNSSGFTSGPVSLLELNPAVYTQLRIAATYSDSGGSPLLNDWTVSWGYAVSQPTLLSLFDNEKTGTTTPTFTFVTSDPQNDALEYQIQWSASNDFSSATTRTSGSDPGFDNTASSTDTSPFSHNETIRFAVQAGDALNNGSTYWWRVRARDPAGGNVWSVWSAGRSFTVDTAVTVSTWFQTTDEQFDTDTVATVEPSGSDSVVVALTLKEAMIAYNQRYSSVPRYRLWNGQTWSSEQSAQSLDALSKWVELAAGTQRNEYALSTIDATGKAQAQIYTASTTQWSNLVTLVNAVGNPNARGHALAYETDSGELVTVACSGNDAIFRVWDGASWTGTAAVGLSFTQNCEWLRLAADPESNDMILIARANIAEAPDDFEAVVWDGTNNTWGDYRKLGNMAEAANEGMTVAYERDGSEALVVVSNGGNPNFIYDRWNGASWQGTSTVTLEDDFESGDLIAHPSTNELSLCYVDQDGNFGHVVWDGNSWSGYTELPGAFIGSKLAERTRCAYETTAGREGYVSMVYNDDPITRHHVWDRSVWSAGAQVSTLGEADATQLARTGEGLLLGTFTNRDLRDSDFTYWNGLTWAAVQTLEDNQEQFTNDTRQSSIVAREYPGIDSGVLYSSPIVFSEGSGPGWAEASWNDSTPVLSNILYQVEYYDSNAESWELVPDGVLAGNGAGTTTSPIDLSNLDYNTYDMLRLRANFSCVAGDCPELYDWTVTWAEGVTVSGTAQAYDLATNVTSGTVAVAVNGVLQSGKTGTISGGTWSIPNVPFFPGDTVQVWITGADDANEAVAVTRAIGAGNLQGMKLYERHLTLGHTTSASTTNAHLALYDNSVSGNEDIFFDVTAGNDLSLCADNGCSDAGLVVLSGHTFRPDSSNAGDVTTHDIRIDGTFTQDGNGVFVSGSWDNNGTTTVHTGSLTFTATSSAETIDSTGSALSSFTNVVFGQGSGNATWTLQSAFDINGNLTLSYGTLVASTSPITLAGNLSLGTGSTYLKGSATTTFDGTGTHTITDAHTAKQDLGNVLISGASKTVRLQSSASTTDLTIATGNTFDLTSNNYPLTIYEDLANSGTFTGQNGTVYFAATTTGRTIRMGASSLPNATFMGTGGNWAFPESSITVARNLTIQDGIVTFPTGTLSVGQSLTVLGGQFVHNNGTVRMTSTATGRSVTPLASPFYNLTFFGTGGGWSFGQTNATTSNSFTIGIGSVTLPSGLLYVAGDFVVDTGTLNANGGLVHLNTTMGQKLLTLSGSTLNEVRFTGTSGGGGGWYDSTWSHRIEITVPAAQVDDDLTDFPVYIDLSLLGDHFWSNVNAQGDDIRVTDGTGTTELAVDLVSIATTTRTGELHFKASTLASTTNNTFYLYYGNSLAEAVPEGSEFGSEAVWSNGYLAVYHLDEEVAGSGNNSVYTDSTRYDEDGDDFLVTSAASGRLGRAADMTPVGTADYIRIPHTVLDGETDVVASWWMRTSDTGSQAVISGANTGDNNEFLMFFNTNTTFVPYNSSANVTFDISAISNNAWRYVVYEADDAANRSYLWIDGAADNENPEAHTIGALSINSGGLILGQEQDSVGGGYQDTQALDGYLDEVRFATTTRSTGWISTEYKNQGSVSSFFSTSTAESVASRTFTDTNASIAGDVTIENGLVTFPSGTLTLGGSFTNSGSFIANSGTVLFATSSTGHTVTAGGSGFHNVTFNNAAGGWTLLDHATTTNNFTITAANDFTVDAGVRVAVLGQFANSAPAATDWTGSTLSLRSGTAYTIGTKAQSAETYGTLEIANSTDIRLWQSNAAGYSVAADSSLYSQDHAATDGALHIFGSYERTTGSDYWSALTDFDGTGIAGAPRAVSVQLASGASAAYTNASLEVLGTSTATTTVTNQVSGTFGLTLTNSTLNAQYYAMEDMNQYGLALLGTTTVTNLSNGAFTLSTNGGSMLTISSSTINAAPAKEIQLVSFATSTGVTSGYNVTATGTATSYWWFRNHYGNYDGESFDNDPAAGPGSLRWDDSGYSINISGTVYANEASGGAPAECNGSSQVVRIVVNGGSAFTAPCTAGTGAYTVSGVSFTGDAVLTAYLDTNGGSRAATVSRTPSGNITGFDLYENRLIVRHEGVNPLSIAHLAYFDSSEDTDVPFAATTTTNTLVTEPDTELFVWTTKTFTPGGNVTLESGGSGASYDGSLVLATSSSFIAQGTETHRVGGSWIARSGSAYTRAQSTVDFTATTSGKVLQPGSAFYDVVFSDNGSWRLAANATVERDVALNAGTIYGTSSLTIETGTLEGNGTTDFSGGTVTVETSGDFGGSSNWSFYNLTLGDGAGGATTKVGAGNLLVRSVLTVQANHTVNAGDDNWTFHGLGSVFVQNGTWNPDTSTTTYATGTAMTVAAEDYYNLVLAPAVSGSPTYTFAAGNPTAYSLTIGDGTNPVTVAANTNNPLIDVEGDVTIDVAATFSAAGSNDLRIGGSFTNQGTFTGNTGSVIFDSTDTGEVITTGGSSFHHMVLNGIGGGWTVLDSATTTGNLALTAGSAFTQSPGTTIKVQGAFSNAIGDVTDWTGATLYLNSGTSYSINTKTDPGDVYESLVVGGNTDVRMWKSTSTTYSIDPSGSLYSQDHNGADGDLYIWGDYVRNSGSEHWSYNTDFDGTDISGTPRIANVYLADGATTTLSGGSLVILGTASASTTIQAQDGGTYGLRVTGGTFTARYYRIRDIVAEGLYLSGSPTVTQMGNGDFYVDIEGGVGSTIAGSVIDQNPVKTWAGTVFNKDGGVTTAYNVRVTGSSVSSWRFIPGSGDLYGENFDDDPGGNPGYAIFTDSAADVTISGNVYSDEVGSVSALCNGSSQVVRLVVNGDVTASSTSSCAPGSGLYSIPGVTFAPGDTITVYLDTNGGAQAANITRDLITSINDMHLYENRVVVRHEDTTAASIHDFATWDSGDDSDLPFTASTSSSPADLTLDAEKKLIVWNSKTFTPDGDVTLLSGGSGQAYDGTLALRANAGYVSSSTVSESIDIGGSWSTDSGATFSAGLSSVTMSATTSGKTISPDQSAFHDLTFDGVGGSWTFADTNATTTGDFTIANGTVAVASSTLAVGGSFANSGSMSAASTSITFSSGNPETVTFNGYTVGSLSFTGTGLYTMTDTNATSTGSVTIAAGSVLLPSGTFSVAESFENTGGSFTHSGTLRLYGALAAQSIELAGSKLRNLSLEGTGSWAFVDTTATTTGSTTIYAGGLTAPSVLFSVGGSLINESSFNANGGDLYFFATTSGQTVNTGGTVLSNVTFNGIGGGWTFATSATTTGAFRLQAGSAFTLASTSVLEVQGSFQNEIGGTATNWTDSTLYLNASGTSYTINQKTAAGDTYATTTIGANTDVRMWNSSSASTSVATTSSLYSMDHADQPGDLYIYGEYLRTTGADYWSYATDFDGAALGGSSRQVDVRVASSSSLTYTGGTLAVVGAAGATSTIAVQGTGAYSVSLTGGTLNARYYSFRNLTSVGLSLGGSLTVTSLSDGDFELAIDGGRLITLASTVLDQNPIKTISGVRFATSSGVATGTNVYLSGTSNTFWDITNHPGNFAGEDHDVDGIDACGSIRWDDSTCLEVSQAHYRFRADDGGEGAAATEWFDNDWSYRKRVTITNPNSSTLTNYPVRLLVSYESGKMLANFDDIRFTDSSGTTSIPYFVEAATAATATVWVKVPSVAGQSSESIFMYYDNEFAPNAESGDQTFTYFDNFEDDNIAEYSGDTGYFDVVADSGAEGSFVLEAESSKAGDITVDGIYDTGTAILQGSTLRFMQYVDSTWDDEPCMLFGVQTPGSDNQNYAVCLDQYPSDRIILAKNVESNDGSGEVLASTTVSWTSGWYTALVDWLADDSITVRVYNASGAQVGSTISDTDTDYTAGGIGFAFWGQHGGWDLLTAYPYAASVPTYSFGSEQVGGGATWFAAQDTPANVDSNTTFRIRMSVENSGPQIDNQQFRLQYAPKTGYGTCAAVPDVVYDDVPNQIGCGVNDICMVTSAQFSDQSPTTQALLTSSALAFTPGYIIEDPSNQSTAMTVATSSLTELEYAIELTSFANESAYCLRTTNGGIELDSYANIAEVGVNGVPVVTTWSLNSNKNISLVEGETTTIYATGTVTDVNGFADLLYATTTVYRSGVGSTCSEDVNNCYPATSLACPLTNCSGNTCDIECSVDIWYLAEPTDNGSPNSADTWRADVFVTDISSNVATDTSSGVELNTLWGLGLIGGTINYGVLSINEDTGAVNELIQTQNTGNSSIDVQVAGTDMVGGASTIPAGNQLYATSSFSYSTTTCIICEALSGTASDLELDLPKPTATSTPVTDDIYWGVYVPYGANAAPHQGQNTFYAIGD